MSKARFFCRYFVQITSAIAKPSYRAVAASRLFIARLLHCDSPKPIIRQDEDRGKALAEGVCGVEEDFVAIESGER